MNAMFQSLESRMLRAAVTAVLNNGKLTVTGTEAADGIYIDQASTSPSDGYDDAVGVYTANPGEGGKLIAKFDATKVKSLLVDAKGGNDTVELGLYALGYQYNVPITLLGGNGNDRLSDSRITSATNILIDGGSGDDQLFGTDSITGGTGNDTITALVPDYEGEGPGPGTHGHFDGGDGNDVIHGTQGDTITGGIGDDTIYNGAVVDAGAGFDKVYTHFNSVVHLGADNDKLYVYYNATDYSYGSAHPDYVGPTSITAYGDAGNDIIQVIDDSTPLMTNHILKVYGGDGNDTLYGGAGANRLFGQKGIDVIHAKNGVADQIIGSQDGDNILDRDAFDVLKAS